jgi:hypothetical protein
MELTVDQLMQLFGQQVAGLCGRSLQDIDDERQRAALRSTAGLRRAAHAARPLVHRPFRLRREDRTPRGRAEGLVLEFGVATGDTLSRIAAKRSPAHGFDSFEGLPEDWRTGFTKGAFAQAAPTVPGATLHVGWFEDTLPGFFATHPGPIAFAHIDADLYSSTVTIFREAEDRLVEGSVLLFDEYFNFPGGEQHEHKAFTEFIERTGHGFEYLAYNSLYEQVLVRLTS